MLSDPILTRHLEKLIERAQAPSPSLQRLPHPARLDALGFDEVLRAMLGGARSWLDDALCDASIPLDDIMHRAATDPNLSEMQQFYSFDPYNRNAGSLRSQLMYLRYKAIGGTVLQTTDALEILLDDAAIGDGVPVEYLRPPFPACFIAFGSAAVHSRLRVTDAHGDTYPLEGLYVLEDIQTIDPDDPAQALALKLLHGHRRGQLVRTLSFVACGSPRGRANPLDDYVQVYSLYLPLADGARPLADVLEEQSKAHNQVATQVGAAPVSEDEAKELREAILHLVRVLLYLNVRSTRTQLLPERTDWIERLGRVRGGKRKRLERRGQAFYDRVEVGPAQLPDTLVQILSGAEGQGEGVRPHWRRGHFHTVCYGPERRRRRLEFFAPTLVRADKLDDGAPPVARYRVT